MSIKTKIDGIKEILVEDDLMGLIKIGAPLDEYDSEAESLSMAVTHNSSVNFIQESLWNVFYNSFCHTISITKVNNKNSKMKAKFMTMTNANKMIGKMSRYKKTATKLRKFLKTQAP